MEKTFIIDGLPFVAQAEGWKGCAECDITLYARGKCPAECDNSSITFKRINPHIHREWQENGVIFQMWYGRIDRFEIVNDIPDGHVPWNISRDSFKDKRIIPLCKFDANYHVDPKSLKAYYCKDRETADRIWRDSHCGHDWRKWLNN